MTSDQGVNGPTHEWTLALPDGSTAGVERIERPANTPDWRGVVGGRFAEFFYREQAVKWIKNEVSAEHWPMIDLLDGARVDLPDPEGAYAEFQAALAAARAITEASPDPVHPQVVADAVGANEGAPRGCSWSDPLCESCGQDVAPPPGERCDICSAVAGEPLPVVTDHELSSMAAYTQEWRDEGEPYTTKASGERETFITGSRRDSRAGKGRYDLLPHHGVRRVAQLYERGAERYGAKNWAKGQPLSRLADSMLRHAFQAAAGVKDEDHLAAVVFNALAMIDHEERIATGELPAELDDLRSTE